MLPSALKAERQRLELRHRALVMAAPTLVETPVVRYNPPSFSTPPIRGLSNRERLVAAENAAYDAAAAYADALVGPGPAWDAAHERKYDELAARIFIQA